MVKAIIFDLDGTLLNTIEDIHFVLNESLAEFGLPRLSLRQTMQYVGNGARKLVERAVGDNAQKLENVYGYYAKRFSECGNERTKLYEGEEQALSALKAEGIKFAIITNKPQRATQNVYAKYLSKFEFCEVLGQTEYYALKPNPASTLAVIDRLGVNKDDSVFVGDGETDVLTAKAAGIKCISALWGYRSKDQLKAVGASCFAENYEKLKEIITNNYI